MRITPWLLLLLISETLNFHNLRLLPEFVFVVVTAFIIAAHHARVLDRSQRCRMYSVTLSPLWKFGHIACMKASLVPLFALRQFMHRCFRTSSFAPMQEPITIESAQ